MEDTDFMALGRPVLSRQDAPVGYRLDGLNVNLGVGDLLVFSLFAVAASKEHGRRGTVTAAAAITLFGALTPILLPAALAFGDTDGGFVIPAQAFFGPARSHERCLRSCSGVGKGVPATTIPCQNGQIWSQSSAVASLSLDPPSDWVIGGSVA